VSVVRIYDPIILSGGEWRQLQSIQREALMSVVDKDVAEDMVGWNDGIRYASSHIDPNTEVGEQFNANQIYTKPRVAVATRGGEPVGFGYTARNASGGGSPESSHNDSLQARAVRRAKLMSIAKNYLWVREVAVLPREQMQGTGRQIGRALLKDAMPPQPVTTYIYPSLMPSLQPVLERYGFLVTGSQSKKDIKMLRMEAPSVRTVLEKMAQPFFEG
jgi:hypothetical protein